jgi:hypothetical protein
MKQEVRSKTLVNFVTPEWPRKVQALHTSYILLQNLRGLYLIDHYNIQTLSTSCFKRLNFWVADFFSGASYFRLFILLTSYILLLLRQRSLYRRPVYILNNLINLVLTIIMHIYMHPKGECFIILIRCFHLMPVQ